MEAACQGLGSHSLPGYLSCLSASEAKTLESRAMDHHDGDGCGYVAKQPKSVQQYGEFCVKTFESAAHG